MNRALEIVELLEYLVETTEETGRILPFAAVKRSLSDLRQLVQNADYENEIQISGERYNSRRRKTDQLQAKANFEGSNLENNEIGYSKVRSEKLNSEINNETRSAVVGGGGVSSRGLANRIKPIPAEVRGRVRELVDLISDEDQFEDAIESNKM